jgi:hypothetical protein
MSQFNVDQRGSSFGREMGPAVRDWAIPHDRIHFSDMIAAQYPHREEATFDKNRPCRLRST